VGADHRRLLPAAFWLGAALMLVVDDMARTAYSGVGIAPATR
jgi:iron complex transport system permease protein